MRDFSPMSSHRCAMVGCDRDSATLVVVPTDGDGVGERRLCQEHSNSFLSSFVAKQSNDDTSAQPQAAYVPCKVALLVFNYDAEHHQVYISHAHGVDDVPLAVEGCEQLLMETPYPALFSSAS